MLLLTPCSQKSFALSLVDRYQGKDSEADALYVSAITIAERALDEDDLEVVYLFRDRAQVLRKQVRKPALDVAQ